VKVLIVKLSSMGDLIQALPALSDAMRARPDTTFDWAVDEAFAEIPAWHPAVRRVIRTAHRRWRRRPLAAWRSGELGSFVRQLRAERYDKVIDAQTNLKSAVVTRLARGLRCGPDAASAREWGAHWAYQQRVAVGQHQLAIERWRQMFAHFLEYPRPDGPPDFGLQQCVWPAPEPTQTGPYLIAVTNASWDNKCWPEAHWRQLVELAVADGYRVLLPWGTAAERERAERIAGAEPQCLVLPRLSLTALAGLISRSAGSICNDTGLAHLSACLGVPTVTLYGPTDPALIGATGTAATQLLAQGYDCIPCYRRRCEVDGYRGPQGQCLQHLSAPRVWHALVALQRAPIATAAG